MKFRILVTAILAAPLCLPTTVQAEAHPPVIQPIQPSVQATQADWSEFSSTQGGFAVSMPGTPQEKIQTDVDRSFLLTLGKSYYYVHYTDIPDIEKLNADELKDLLDKMPMVFVEGVEGKLVTERNVILNGYLGKEFEFTLGDDSVGQARVYMVEQRLFIIVGMSSEPENAQKFLQSFRLL